MKRKEHELWQNLLRLIVSNPSLHARWLCSLSYLELTGAKKIAASVRARRCPYYMLQHLSEESRHALFFRSRVKDIGKNPADDYPLLGGNSLKWYLHRTDQFSARLLRDFAADPETKRFAAYFLTTLAVELRAEWLYPLYETILKEEQAPFSVRSIIREEEAHLKLVHTQISRLSLESLIPMVAEQEQIFFTDLSSGLKKDLEYYLPQYRPLGGKNHPGAADELPAG